MRWFNCDAEAWLNTAETMNGAALPCRFER
jgi:hypothetical protein